MRNFYQFLAKGFSWKRREVCFLLHAAETQDLRYGNKNYFFIGRNVENSYKCLLHFFRKPFSFSFSFIFFSTFWNIYEQNTSHLRSSFIMRSILSGSTIKWRHNLGQVNKNHNWEPKYRLEAVHCYVLICDMVRSRRFENLYHNRSGLENIRTDLPWLWRHAYLMMDMHTQDSGGRAFSYANISKSREDNEDL